MGIAWPAALLGLIALALPLLIHLLARGEFQRVAVATTQFVRERPRLRWRRMQISHPLLLALRLALVALCVLLIGEPFRHLSAGSDGGTPWTLVSAQVEAAQARVLTSDGNAAARWLAPGFPSLDEPRPQWQAGQLWSLIDAADRQAPGAAAFDIIVPTTIAPPGTVRPTLARKLRWIDAGPMTINTDKRAPLNVDIVYDAERRQAADEVATAVAAWRDAGLNASANLIPATATNARAPFIVWLSSSALPEDDATSRVVVAQRPLLGSTTVPVRFRPDGSVALRAQHAAGFDVRIMDDMFAADGAPHINLARELLDALLRTKLYSPPANYPTSIAQLMGSNNIEARADMRVRQPLISVFVWLFALIAALE